MKSLTVWHGHSTRPSLPAGTARKGNGHLSGRGPSICCCKTVRSLQSPTGAFIAALRKHEFALAGRTGSSYPRQKKNRAFPTGNALLYISLSSVVFCRVRPIQGRTLFFYYDSSFSTRSIRYPTPTWVWIRCGASGHRSNFLRRDAM